MKVADSGVWGTRDRDRIDLDQLGNRVANRGRRPRPGYWTA